MKGAYTQERNAMLTPSNFLFLGFEFKAKQVSGGACKTKLHLLARSSQS